MRSNLLGLLAGIGVAAIALFGHNTTVTILDFLRETRRDGFVTTASTTVTPTAIQIDARMVPLPSTFWQDEAFSIPAPELFEENTESLPPYVEVKSGPSRPIQDPEKPAPAVQPESTPPPAPTPEPTPNFNPDQLRRAIHNNLASVFTGDLPYLLLKSGDRLYPGSRLCEGVVLEAISPKGVLCSTPVGILKIEPQPDDDASPALEDSPAADPLQLDAPLGDLPAEGFPVDADPGAPQFTL